MLKTSKIFYIHFNHVKWYACRRYFIYILTVLNGTHVEDVRRYFIYILTVLNGTHVEDVEDIKNTYYIDF